MARRVVAVFLAGALGVGAAAPADAAATVACRYNGKNVQAVVTNSKDGPRSCNAACVWRYGNVAYRGTGGAVLEDGETKTVYNSVAPYKIDGVVASDIQCNR